MIILLASLIMGGIYGGVFTPTEAGAAGAFGALIIIIIQRRFTWKMLTGALLGTIEFTAQVFLILIGAFIFSKFLVLTGVSAQLSEFLMTLTLPQAGIVALVILIYVFLGFFMDGIAILSITMPIIFPVIATTGYDPIWFGVIAIVAVELGIITPPFGMSVYIVKAASPVPLRTDDIFKASIPFYIVYLITAAILIFFPQIVLVLPHMMMK
jgi:tripartite ATP-independent transporter DctM subunit